LSVKCPHLRTIELEAILDEDKDGRALWGLRDKLDIEITHNTFIDIHHDIFQFSFPVMDVRGFKDADTDSESEFGAHDMLE
jgi:hypothetical protein